MSVLVVGVSHRSAPVSVLEALALDAEGAAKLALQVSEHDHVNETVVLATCNRIEVYADVERFHGSIEATTRLLADRAGRQVEELLPHLYVHYDDGAVSHLFHVAAGLDSMALGEAQVLGQCRDALRAGQETGTVGATLNLLFQQALRVGKRVHAETDVDRTAPSMVSAALAQASVHIGDLAGRRAVVVGAGSMAAIAVATTARAGADVVVVNRSLDRAAHLAAGYAATARPFSELADAVSAADLVISCTGATGTVVSAHDVSRARRSASRPLVVVDLALPHDVDPAVTDLSGVHLINLASLAESIGAAEAESVLVHDAPVDGSASALSQVRRIVADELAAFGAARRSASVTPTLVALRSMATAVVEAELERLRHRLPHLDAKSVDEVSHAIRRVAEKLLHQPTVRVKELAKEPGTLSYATALAELFALDPDAVDAVTTPLTDEGGLR